MLELCFKYEFDDRAAFDAEARGYLGDVTLCDGAGRYYALAFYDAVRLSQDLEEETKQHRPFIAEPGLIVVSDVTLDVIRLTLRQLYDSGFFHDCKHHEQEVFEAKSRIVIP